MRIAISGSHCTGKTTLVEAFLAAHPDYAHEPEPYTVLLEDYGEEFAAEPCADDFYRQLEFSVERLRARASDNLVIFDRCPIDFLAYLLALKDLKKDNVTASLLEAAMQLVFSSIQILDLVVFLPVDDEHLIEIPDDEQPELRSATDVWLDAFYNDDHFSMSCRCAAMVEIRGTVAERLAKLEGATLNTQGGGLIATNIA